MPVKGLLTPFQRDRRSDFASGSGWPLAMSKVGQVLGVAGDTETTVGELPWRTEFGSGIHLLRHRNNTGVLSEVARVRFQRALRRWVPGLVVSEVEPVRDGETLTLRVSIAEGPGGAAKTTEVRR